MSSAARWANTSKATHWPLSAPADWKGAPTFGAPVVFDCDYKAEARKMTNSRGQEFTSRQQIYTERPSIHPGDRVLIGESALADPVAAGAEEVMAVARFADTLEGQAEDFMVVT
jgi:hypothetical protein